jgi:peptidoglycan/LPS O-acetylase OafA/YrhL
MKKSWKTTFFGAGGLVGVWVAVLCAIFDGDPSTAPDYTTAITVSLPALGLLFARDNGVTSEQAGAK